MNRRWIAAIALGAAVLGLGGAVPTLAQTGGSESGVFAPLAPERILDTRTGNGVTAPGKLGTDTTFDLQVAGRGGVPAEATAVVLNLTATEGTLTSFLTLFPAGTPRPNASTINFRPGDNIANMVTVKLGTEGKLFVYNFTGDVHVIADVAGYYVDGLAEQDVLKFRVKTSDEELLDESPGITNSPFDTIPADGLAQVRLPRPVAGCVFSGTAEFGSPNAIQVGRDESTPATANNVYVYYPITVDFVDVIILCG